MYEVTETFYIQPSLISRWGFMEFILYSYELTAVKFTILFAESATNIDVPHSH